MNSSSTALADAYVRATNRHDSAAFLTLFADGAIVNDNGREMRGLESIKSWSDREIFAANVTLEVLNTSERDGETVVTTKVDGNFDRTGLPDPVIINQHITSKGDKIIGLICRLATEPSPI